MFSCLLASNMSYATNLIRMPILAVAIAVVMTMPGCGGGKPVPEEAMIGQWTMDKGETEKTNAFAAAAPGLTWFEIKSDGSYAEGLMGGTFKGKWKQVKKDNASVTLEVAWTEEKKEPSVIEVAVVNKDHITVNYPKGMGVIHLRRATQDVAVAATKGKDDEKTTPSGATQTPNNQQKKPTEEKKEEDKPAEELSKIPPDFKMTAQEFHSEFMKNTKTAEAKFNGKVIELSGEVSAVGHNMFDEYAIVLKVEGDFAGVRCLTADDEPWSKVCNGQKVKVKGKRTAICIGATILGCVVVDSDPSPAVVMTAEQLAKEFAANPDEAKSKYPFSKQVILSGEILDKKYDEQGHATVTFKTQGKIRVQGVIASSEKKLSDNLKIDQQLKGLAGFLTYSDDRVLFSSFLPFKPNVTKLPK